MLKRRLFSRDAVLAAAERVRTGARMTVSSDRVPHICTEKTAEEIDRAFRAAFRAVGGVKEGHGA